MSENKKGTFFTFLLQSKLASAVLSQIFSFFRATQFQAFFESHLFPIFKIRYSDETSFVTERFHLNIEIQLIYWHISQSSTIPFFQFCSQYPVYCFCNQDFESCIANTDISSLVQPHLPLFSKDSSITRVNSSTTYRKYNFEGFSLSWS